MLLSEMDDSELVRQAKLESTAHPQSTIEVILPVDYTLVLLQMLTGWLASAGRFGPAEQLTVQLADLLVRGLERAQMPKTARILAARVQRLLERLP